MKENVADLLRALVEFCAESFSKLLYFGADDRSSERWTWRELLSALFFWVLCIASVIYLVFF